MHVLVRRGVISLGPHLFAMLYTHLFHYADTCNRVISSTLIRTRSTPQMPPLLLSYLRYPLLLLLRLLLSPLDMRRGLPLPESGREQPPLMITNNRVRVAHRRRGGLAAHS